MKWAKCNIGAKTETDYGYYFQWGDIKNKSNAECSWTTYKYCSDGTESSLTKYITNSSFGTVDNKTTLESMDDAAAQIMGGDWRMPTWSECQELIDNTTNIWVANYNDTGVNGRKFTSKTNGNSIFIPASGFRDGLMVYDREDYGYIWSSSLYRLPSTAYKLYFKSKNIFAESESPRRLGLPVRGVFK